MATAEESYRLVMESVAEVRGAIITSQADFTPELASAKDRVLPTLTCARLDERHDYGDFVMHCLNRGNCSV